MQVLASRFKYPSGMLTFLQLFHIAEEETCCFCSLKICKMLPVGALAAKLRVIM